MALLLDVEVVREALRDAGLQVDEKESVVGRMVTENMMVVATSREFLILVEGADGSWTRVTQPQGGAPPRRRVQV